MQVGSSINNQSNANLNWITFEFPINDEKWKCSRATLDKVAAFGSSYFSMVKGRVEDGGQKVFHLEVMPKLFIKWIVPYILHGVLRFITKTRTLTYEGDIILI